MNSFEKHKKVWTIIVAISSIALILATFLPYLALR